jgi:hypothetical protein
MVATLRVLAVSALLISFSCFGDAQDVLDSIVWFHPNQELRVPNLPPLTAPSLNSSAVLTTALEIVVHNERVCCGKDSALADAVLSEPRSLKELGARLQEQRWSGPPVMARAKYVPGNSINSDLIMGALLDQHALLMEWKSHFYILQGAVFNETLYYSGARQYAILKLLLIDPRFSDQRREVTFNREADSLENVQGLLALVLMRQ